MFFVPKMKYSLSGHVVSIQSSSSDTPRPLLDTRGEIKRMVQLLATIDTNNYVDETQTSTDAPMQSVNVQLTTVLCNQNVGRQNTNSDGNKVNLTNVSAQIIAGIQRERTLIKINESKSLIQSICNFFPKN